MDSFRWALSNVFDFTERQTGSLRTYINIPPFACAGRSMEERRVPTKIGVLSIFNYKSTDHMNVTWRSINRGTCLKVASSKHERHVCIKLSARMVVRQRLMLVNRQQRRHRRHWDDIRCLDHIVVWSRATTLEGSRVSTSGQHRWMTVNDQLIASSRYRVVDLKTHVGSVVTQNFEQRYN